MCFFAFNILKFIIKIDFIRIFQTMNYNSLICYNLKLLVYLYFRINLTQIELILANIYFLKIMANSNFQEIQWFLAFTLNIKKILHLLYFFFLSFKFSFIRIQNIIFFMYYFKQLFHCSVSISCNSIYSVLKLIFYL